MNNIFNKNKVVTFDSLVNEFFNVVDNIDTVYNSLIKSNNKELDDKYILELVVAGYKKEDVKLEILNGILTISSVKKEETENTTFGFGKSPFSKQFRIPEDVDTNNIKATQSDGILTVELFKYTDDKSGKKTITID